MYDAFHSGNCTASPHFAVTKNPSLGFEFYDGIDWRSASEWEIDTPGTIWRHKGTNERYKTIEVRSIEYRVIGE